MSNERKTVKVLKSIHEDANIAASIVDQDIQEFADSAFQSRIDSIIKPADLKKLKESRNRRVK